MPTKKSGFTLVEIIIVIAIISILSVIGVVQYNNFQKNARDAKRKGDIDAIVKAMEVNKTATSYQLIQASWFSGHAIPFDPKATAIRAPSPANSGCGDASSSDPWAKGCWYCLKSANPPVAGLCSGPDAWTDESNSFYFGTRWMFCANLEVGPTGANFYCRGSQQ